jgi:crotonobetainyl-CoA:carnitine CoA-transferase CaiB-like acyl-CoA transferase
MIKQRIKAYENPQRKIQELQDALAAEWAKVTHEEILALVDTMPEPCAAVKAANDGPTK